MNGKKAKAIRRAFRGAGRPEVDYRYSVSVHPFVSLSGDHNVRYKFQRWCGGWKEKYKFGKRIYKLTGVLPRIPKATPC